MRSRFPGLVTLLLATSLLANDEAYRAFQSGTTRSAPTVHAHGIYGQGEIIGVLDTGADYDLCYLSEPDGSAPPVNFGLGTLTDPSRRKIIAYDFLYSCAERPGARGCDDPSSPLAWDNQGHGTRAAAAAAGDAMTPLVHDAADAIAPAAQLVIQDAGYIGGDACTQRPGLGCPTRDLRPVLQQAYDQGVRVHSNSWGDRQGAVFPMTPPTANYGRGAQQIDDFVWRNPDMVVVFNSGNAGTDSTGVPRFASSVSSPGAAKNTIQVGGFDWGYGPGRVINYSGRGPTLDGRIKPDLMGPAWLRAGIGDGDVSTGDCEVRSEGGTSWASPVVAGAAALVRQYFRSGFYPGGQADPGDAFTPSAALVKAALIASTRAIPFDMDAETEAPPSYDQGFGRPVLDDALYFAGDARRLLVYDRDGSAAIRHGEVVTHHVRAEAGQSLRAALVWTDPPGDPSLPSTASQLVHDLDLQLIAPDGTVFLGNESLHPGQSDRLNNVEAVEIPAPQPGAWRVVVTGWRVRAEIGSQPYALVITGDVTPAGRMRGVRR